MFIFGNNNKMVISVKKGKLYIFFFRTVGVKFQHLFEHPVASNYNALRTCLKRRTPIF